MKRKIGGAMPRTPKAHGFRLARCSKPGCGPHIVAFDRDGNDICDIAVPLKGMPSFVGALQAMSYEAAVERDDG